MIGSSVIGSISGSCSMLGSGSLLSIFLSSRTFSISWSIFSNSDISSFISVVSVVVISGIMVNSSSDWSGSISSVLVKVSLMGVMAM